MAKASPILENFNTGEMSPLLAGRVGFDKYPNGASILENFIPTTQGPNQRRAGTRFVYEVKDSAKKVLLVPFEYSVTQAYMLEFGDFYVRFYTWDAVTKVRGILESSPGVPVEVVTPYSEADLYNTDGTPRLRFVQSGDFLYLAHSAYQPRILKRLSATSFSMDLFESTGGPWMALNDTGVAVGASAETGSVTLNATSALFSADHVGALFYMEEPNTNSNKAWEVGKAITAGMRRRSDNKTYEALNSATTGTSKPVHTEGALLDGDAGVQWQYRDPGYGYVRITGYTSPTQVSATVIDRLPSTLVGVSSAAVKTITSISDSGGNVQAVVAGHGYAVGSSILLNIVRTRTLFGTTYETYSATHQVTVVVDVNTVLTDAVFTTVIPLDVFEDNEFYSGTTQQTGALSTRWAFGEWSNAKGWPSDVAFFRERLWWGRGRTLWSSVSADFTDYSPKTFGTVTADMAITVSLVSGRINDIQWLAADKDLVAGTAGGEFAIGELSNGDPLGPANKRSRIMSTFGSRAIPPIKNVESLLFVQRSGLKARETFYDFASDGYKSSDTTVLSEHITASGITQMAFAADPDQVVWCIRADGALLGFTWNNEQAVRGWHRHPIGGSGIVESVAVIPAAEGDRSELWMVVKRTINGVTKRYVEYLERPYRIGDAQASQFYVDSGLTYTGAATTTISGLTHLEGQTVSVLVNGAPHPNVVVTSGTITLQIAATTAQIGLPCPARYRSMRLEAGAQDGTSQGKTKRIHKCVLRLLYTGGGKYGAMNGGPMDNLLLRSSTAAMNQPAPLFTGDKVVPWPDGYNTEAYVGFEIDQPVNAVLVAVMPQIVTQDAR